jgi:hypothetical protein
MVVGPLRNGVLGGFAWDPRPLCSRLGAIPGVENASGGVSTEIATRCRRGFFGFSGSHSASRPDRIASCAFLAFAILTLCPTISTSAFISGVVTSR